MFYKNPKSQRENPFRKIYDNQNFIRVLAKEDKPVNFPYLIDIELTNNCNLRCLFCGQQAMTRKRGFIREKLFKKVVNECTKYNTPIRLIRWGEPFLHPKIISFLKYAKNKGLLVHITTNGLLLNEEKMKAIVDLGLDSLIFSMQGATKEEYQKMRNNPLYDRFKTNINQLIKLRGGKNRPYIHISCTVTDETKAQIRKYIKYWGSIVDSVGVGKTNLSRFTPAQIKNFEIVGKIEELKKQEKIKKEYRPCTEVYQKLSVNFDGSVSACCGDYDNYLIVGDLNKQTLFQIWNKSEELKIYRFLLNKGYFRSLTLCSTCYHAYDEF
jgi:MoaA/NifB/PqqE/SkfB family radical SAM enzyme